MSPLSGSPLLHLLFFRAARMLLLPVQNKRMRFSGALHQHKLSACEKSRVVVNYACFFRRIVPSRGENE